MMLPGEYITLAPTAQHIQAEIPTLDLDCGELSVLRDSLSRLQNATPFTGCWVHGDFAPWNIRHAPDGTVLLLDWEDAERGGLPLHDAFHFLHMQDFLFGGRPTTHAKDFSRLFTRCGLSQEHCWELEIACLLCSYIRQKLRQNHQHSIFLRNTLDAVLTSSPHKASAGQISRLYSDYRS
jgi:hypothetical protein